MTQFGYQPSLSSPAARRMEAAARARLAPDPVFIRPSAEAKQADVALERAAAEARRWRLIDRFETGLKMTRGGRFPPPKTMRGIMLEVCEKYGMTPTELRSKRRGRAIVYPRQEAMYRCAKETRHSQPEIGMFFGFDHTTVLHAIRAHEARMQRGEAKRA